MAKKTAVWGIDIGQCALKALRLQAGDEPGQVVAVGFDYVEYPKILSQPEANPDELVQDALKQFLDRNSVRGDRVAISVSGQSGLARFIKLPPVESKKIPDIVKYEARQQIPFALDDVVWDYQQLDGGSVEEGVALETEVGLFAMKRDQVEQALRPFQTAGIEVDIVQLTPLALYNFIAFDELYNLKPEDYDPDNPPESVVLLAIGTETTDLVVTNGYRVWQRSIPLGGNHFTKALTKELKLTWAKAEHLKRNAAKAENAKVLFQAMRPVFSDLLTEVQRSLGYFSSLDRAAKIGKIVALGNAMKLPGLQRYLAQNLGHKVVKLERFQRLQGSEVLAAPAFKDNVLSFPTSYGLALQGLVETRIRTNLLPPEIVQQRLIRDKKPWAVGAAALLLLGLTLSLFGWWRAVRSVDQQTFAQVEQQATAVANTSRNFISQFDTAKQQFQQTDQIGKNLVFSVEGRRMWLDILTAINACVPHDPDRENKPVEEREELFITKIDSLYVDNLSTWWNGVQTWYKPMPDEAAPKADTAATGPGANSAAGASGAGTPPGAAPQAGAAPGATPTAPGAGAPNAPAAPSTPPAMQQPGAGPATTAPGAAGAGPNATAAMLPGPTGSGWVFQIWGYHYHNPRGRPDDEGPRFVEKTLIKNLHQWRVPAPDGNGTVPVRELGIEYPVLLDPKEIYIEEVPDPNAVVEEEEDENRSTRRGSSGSGLGSRRQPKKKMIQLRRFDFTVQFVWKEPTAGSSQPTGQGGPIGQ